MIKYLCIQQFLGFKMLEIKICRGCFRAGGEEGVVKIDRNDWYKMDNPKRGLCVIINNKEFDPNTRMSERRGTDEDASSLKGIFTDYGFKVVLEHNCTVNKMVDLVLEGKLLIRF